MTLHERLPATLIFDFDSTIINGETLDVLAHRACLGKSNADQIEAEIAAITDLGMNGVIDLKESFARRFALLKPSREDIAGLSEDLLKLLTASVKNHMLFFSEHAEDCYVVSGSFRESILPTTRALGISDSHVFGNELIFDAEGIVVGVDPRIPTSHSGGKADIIQAIRTTVNAQLPIIMVGDGMSDANAKKPGIAADLFFAYTEVVTRESVVALADAVCASIDDVLHEIHALER